MNINSLFYYDKTSPSGLKWKINVYAGKNHNILRAAKSTNCGTKGQRYYTVTYQSKMYIAHRVIWELYYGKPKGTIDHIDGNTFNNSIENLRDVPFEVNSRNKKKSAKNTSGATGVVLTKNGYWKAQWYENGRLKSKYFSIKHENAKEQAISYREQKILELNALGYNYSERHGL